MIDLTQKKQYMAIGVNENKDKEQTIITYKIILKNGKG
jgi:hypothetical protein